MISINLYEILFQCINFVVLLMLLRKFMTKPLQEFLEKRANSIRQNIEKAEKNKIETENLLNEQKELIKKSHQESQEIRKRAEEAASNEVKTTLEKAQSDAKALVDNAKKEIELEYTRASKTLTEKAADLSIMLTEKVLKKSIKKDDHEEILKAYSIN